MCSRRAPVLGNTEWHYTTSWNRAPRPQAQGLHAKIIKKRQIVLFNSRDEMPRIESIDCPREVRSGICKDRELGVKSTRETGLISGVSEELNVPNWIGRREINVGPKLPNVTIWAIIIAPAWSMTSMGAWTGASFWWAWTFLSSDDCLRLGMQGP